MSIVTVGEIAPDFSAIGSDNKQHRLSDYRGTNIILYFYPKDNTPGCTTEACDFRDYFLNIKDLNALVLGVSRDSLATHDKFIKKLGLPFTLLSDEKEELCKLYDVIKEKNIYGKKSFGIERSTFIINEEGQLLREFRKVKVTGHVNEVLEILNHIQKNN